MLRTGFSAILFSLEIGWKSASVIIELYTSKLIVLYQLPRFYLSARIEDAI